jgi:hypothetical protein
VLEGPLLKTLMCHVVPRPHPFSDHSGARPATFPIVPLFERCIVLVADDEPGILRLASHTLTRHGYAVIPASGEL